MNVQQAATDPQIQPTDSINKSIKYSFNKKEWQNAFFSEMIKNTADNG